MSADVVTILIAAILGFVLGFSLGIDGGKNSVAKDCETLGKFRQNSMVFECVVKK